MILAPFALAGGAILVAACSTTIVAAGAGGDGGAAASSHQASSSATTTTTTTTGGSGGGGGCVLSQLPLIVDQPDGVPDRLHVPVTYGDAGAVLLLDTGSATTFLQEPLGTPDPVPNAATLQLGCLSVEVMGRPEVPDGAVNGLPSVGTLGTDRLLSGPTEIDFAGAQLLLHPSGVPFANASSWPEAPFVVLEGAVVVSVQLDGMPVRLILDTGSPDTLWVGQAPQPGDVEVDTMDAYGNTIKLYEGTVDLILGGTQVTVPVLRAPSFPSFKPPAPDIVGLLGLSSLGQSFVIDVDAHVVRLDM